MYSLELPHWGNSNEYTQHTINIQKVEKNSLNYQNLFPGLAPWFTLSEPNYPWLKPYPMVPKMFEPLKFDCTMISLLSIDTGEIRKCFSECQPYLDHYNQSSTHFPRMACPHFLLPQNHPFTIPVSPPPAFFCSNLCSKEGISTWFSARSKNNGLQGIGWKSGGKWTSFAFLPTTELSSV